jgi:phage gp46-like protein
MTDLVLGLNPAFQGFDLVLTDTDLATDDGWTGAVILSAFVDRRAHADDNLPAGADPRGWWGDRVQPLARPQAGNGANPDRIGSRLWLFEREVQSAANLVKAKKILAEAFAWMTEDGYATALAISVWYPRLGVLGFSITATWPDGTTSTHTDELSWGGVA